MLQLPRPGNGFPTVRCYANRIQLLACAKKSAVNGLFSCAPHPFNTSIKPSVHLLIPISDCPLALSPPFPSLFARGALQHHHCQTGRRSLPPPPPPLTHTHARGAPNKPRALTCWAPRRRLQAPDKSSGALKALLCACVSLHSPQPGRKKEGKKERGGRDERRREQT